MKRPSASATVKVGLIQTACSPDRRLNLKKTLAAAERAAKLGAQILCTQELFRSQYFCQSENYDHFKLAEPIPGPSVDALRRFAKERRLVIIASLFEKRARGLYHNTAAIIDADGSHNPDHLKLLWAQREKYDVVIGSRYFQKGTQIVNWPLKRLVLSYSANIYTRVVTGMPVADATGVPRTAPNMNIPARNAD